MNFNKNIAVKIIVAAVIVISVLTIRGADNAKSVPILAYHSVNDVVFGEEGLIVKQDEFIKQMKYLADNGYTALYFDELKDYRKYKKPILITFDDGYMDNYCFAYPIIKQYKFKATVFLAYDFLEKPFYLTKDIAKKLSDTGIFSIQSHTFSHKKLNELDDASAEEEMTRSNSSIEALTGKPVYVLAYPFGGYDSDTIKLASRYYDYGITTKYGFYRDTSNKYEIGRIYVMRSTTMDEFIKSLH